MSLSPKPNASTPSTGTITPIKDVDDIILDEYRRSPQFVYVQERVRKLPPPAKIQTDKFNWNKGIFREKGVPIPIALATQFALALLMVVVPVVLVHGKLIPGAYPLFSQTPPTAPSLVVEILRVIILIGIPYTVYVAIQAGICFIPWITYKSYKASKTEVHEALRTKIEYVLGMREYVGMAVSGTILAAVARILYPHPPPPPTPQLPQGQETPLDITAITSWLSSHANRPYQLYFTNAGLAICIILWVLFVEKFIVRMVAARYHSHGLALRIQINKFARKVTKSIYDYFMETHPELRYKKYDAGMLIYTTLGKETVSKEDFFPYMDEPEAIRYFSILDPDVMGALNQDQFLAAIDSIDLEQSAIDRAFLDQTRIIGRFDNLLMSIVWLLSILILVMIFDPSTRIIIGVMFSFVAGFVFLFQGLAKQAFESIVFVLFTHPFDADDTVYIDEVMYRVHELGLWTSSYLTNGGQLTYIANRTLIVKPIVNLRRSPLMSEFITISVMPTTSKEKIRQLEGRLIDWLKENQRDFVPVMFIRGFKVMDKEHMLLEMNVSHRSNFNDYNKREFRNRKFVMRLKELIQELGIELSPPLVAR